MPSIGLAATRSAWKPCARAQLLQQSCRAFPANVLRQCRGCPPRKAWSRRRKSRGASGKNPAAAFIASFDEPVPVAAVDRWARAQALRAIAFDASAEQELKNAYFATSSPRFLLEAAQRLSIKVTTAPAWPTLASSCRISNPGRSAICPSPHGSALSVPYEAALRPRSRQNDFDPMFAAGLIRQESTFQADAVSHANAIGLMQVLPKTGKLLAKQLKVHYTKNKLFEPDYNIELGMLYIASLVRQTGALDTRPLPITPAKTASPLGKPSAITMRSPSSSSPFRSRKHANMCKSSCATPKSTG